MELTVPAEVVAFGGMLWVEEALAVVASSSLGALGRVASDESEDSNRNLPPWEGDGSSGGE